MPWWHPHWHDSIDVAPHNHFPQFRHYTIDTLFHTLQNINKLQKHQKNTETDCQQWQLAVIDDWPGQ